MTARSLRFAQACLTDRLERSAPQRLGEGYRYGVSDPTGNSILRSEKLIVVRKRLERGSFPQTDGTILRRMAEASIGQAVASAGEGGRDTIPPHAPINVAETYAGTLMTRQLQRQRPGAAISPVGRRRSDSLAIQRREARGTVIENERMSFSRINVWELGDSPPYGEILTLGLFCRYRQHRRCVTNRKKNITMTVLGDPEVACVQHAVVAFVSADAQCVEEAQKSGATKPGGNAGHVFHQRDCRPQRPYEAYELQQQVGVWTLGQAADPALLAERLARGAAGQEQFATRSCTCQGTDIVFRYGPQVCGYEPGS